MLYDESVKKAEEDLQKFLKHDYSIMFSNEFLKKIGDASSKEFSGKKNEYVKIKNFFESEQNNILQNQSKNLTSREMFLWIYNLNKSMKSRLNSFNISVRDEVELSLVKKFKSDTAKIILHVILLKCRIQYGGKFICREDLIEKIKLNKEKVLEKVKKNLIRIYCNDVEFKDYNRGLYEKAINDVDSLFPGSCFKSYDIIGKEQILCYFSEKDPKALEQIIELAKENIKGDKYEVVSLYLGIDTDSPKSYEEIASILKLPDTKVAKLFEAGIKILKWKVELKMN